MRTTPFGGTTANRSFRLSIIDSTKIPRMLPPLCIAAP